MSSKNLIKLSTTSLASGLMIILLLLGVTRPRSSTASPVQNVPDQDSIIELLFQNYQDREFDDLLFAVSQWIACNADAGWQVYDRLTKDQRPNAASIKAELLMHIARGPEMKPWDIKKKADELDPVSSGELALRAVQLMDHEDPFVRGMADFAISIRVGLENGVHDLHSLGPIEVRGLLGHHLQIGVVVHDAVKAVRAVARVVVPQQTEQLDIGPLFAQFLNEILSEGDAPTEVVGEDLADRDVVG